VSEVLILRQLLFHGRRALLVLPYVSICTEKVEQLRRLWGGCGVRVEALFAASTGSWHVGADVGVCTIEKASTLLNRLLEDDALLRDIGVIVVDEMHLLGDEHRGYILELIMLKARLSAAKSVAPSGPSRALQIIGLSATLPNVRILADWLGAHLHISDDRPVPLTLSVASKGQVLPETGAPTSTPKQLQRIARDPDGLVPLVWERMSEGHSVLVFCATKEWCEKAASLLAEELASQQKRETAVLDARLRIVEELRQVPAGLCPVLARTVPFGVAYHHAGLTVEERAILENGFRGTALGCLCATSTLAAGVNLPARRVIIRSLRIGSQALDATRFRQMAGRAGRAGLDCEGECFVVAKTSKEVDAARTLLTAELAPLRSSLHGHRLARAVLEVVSLGLVSTVEALEGSFARSLLRFYEDEQTTEELRQDIDAAVRYLEEQQLVRVDPAPAEEADPGMREGHGAAVVDGAHETELEADSVQHRTSRYGSKAMLLSTPLGDGVVHSALKPSDALGIFEDLQKAKQGIHLDTDLHLIFLATPVSAVTEPNWQHYVPMYEKLPPRERAVADTVGVSYEFLLQMRLGHRGPLPASCRAKPGSAEAADWQLQRERVVALHRRFWAALALAALVGEAPLPRVCALYGIPRGALQSLQNLAGTYCSMVRQLCERLRWHEMAALFEALAPRLSFGISSEIAALCQIPSVYPARARAILQAGLEGPEEVARCTISSVEEILRRLHQFESRCGNGADTEQVSRQQERVVRQAAQRIVRGAQDMLASNVQEIEDEAEDEQLRLRMVVAPSLAQEASTA